jgi:hypothetical protein
LVTLTSSSIFPKRDVRFAQPIRSLISASPTLSDFLLESLFALIYAVENEQARGQRGFFLRRNENGRVV